MLSEKRWTRMKPKISETLLILRYLSIIFSLFHILAVLLQKKKKRRNTGRSDDVANQTTTLQALQVTQKGDGDQILLRGTDSSPDTRDVPPGLSQSREGTGGGKEDGEKRLT